MPQANAVQRIEIERLVGELIASNKDARQAGTPHQRLIHERHAKALRDEIENYVTTLFGLSVADMTVVMAVPVPA